MPSASRPTHLAKILPLDTLAQRLARVRAEGRKIVLCHGVFDLLHPGHVRHLTEAKTMGDVLVVTLTPDRFVNKGPHRPAFPEGLRAEVVAALDAVDYVAVNRWPTAVEALALLRPDVYAKGPDYRDASRDVTGGITLEEQAVRAVGGELRITDDVTFSSSSLLNRHFPSFAPEVETYLDHFRRRHSAADIHRCIGRLSGLKVLVVGETILDEYVYCSALGKSSKEPILALQYLSRDIHAGGALAIANHVAEFARQVDVVTYLGAAEPREDFVRRSLKPNVTPRFVYKAGSPTVVKRRYVESYLLSKLLEIYEMNDEPLDGKDENALCRLLDAELRTHDLVIVADFGHGLVTPRAVDKVVADAPFLAVNTQINAANIGFHTISKYPRADYAAIHEGELRLDARSRDADLNDLMLQVGERLACGMLMVTRGKHGTRVYTPQHGFVDCPAFAVKVVDRIGAGDAVFGVTSLCASVGHSPEVIGFLANLIGAQAVGIVGNSASVDRVQLLKTVDSLLK